MTENGQTLSHTQQMISALRQLSSVFYFYFAWVTYFASVLVCIQWDSVGVIDFPFPLHLNIDIIDFDLAIWLVTFCLASEAF